MHQAASRLSPPVDESRDHVLGEPSATIEIVEYGDYACPHCRAAHADLPRIQRELGERWRYVFRHLPNPRLHPDAELAAEAAEAAGAQGRFWEMHDALLVTAGALDRESLIALARRFDLDMTRFVADLDSRRFAARVREDVDSAIAAGAHGTPTYFVNGRRYDGAWDAEALREAIHQPLGYRLRRASQDFAGLPSSSGALLLAGTVLAQVWANLPASGYDAFWRSPLTVGFTRHALEMPLRELVNQGFMALFFFVVTLEVRREVRDGQLSSVRRARLPVAAAVGGMAAPVLLYAALNAGGPGARGWGIPMGSDTAFVLGLLALFGTRVPLSLRVFVAALAVADDIGAILVIELVSTSHVSPPALAFAAGVFALACLLSRWRVYSVVPYALLGALLWFATLMAGVHATLAAVLLAIAIPTRGRPAPTGLLLQSTAAFKALEAPLPGASVEHRVDAAVRTLETVVDRLLSPARRVERELQPWSAYFVLPVVALANAGMSLQVPPAALLTPVSLGTIFGMALAKPAGIVAVCLLLVRTGRAELPPEVTWRTLIGAAFMCGIGFGEAIFFAETVFTDPDLLAVSKLSIYIGSICAALLGWAVLRNAAAPAMHAARMTPIHT
jgi:NhaA family Na+:H+ antiporter